MFPDVLPHPPTELIGREAELAAIARFLAPDDGPRAGRTRLLTLVGPGGVGKTRLAIEAAHWLAPRFADSAHFVPLVPVADPEQVPFAIAQVLGLSDAAGRPMKERLRDYLSGCEMLLVLDNFEHLLPAAPLVGELLRAAPYLAVLVTSRESLRLSGEQRYGVPPLETPCREPLPQIDVLAQTPGMALFVQRARAVRPNFALTAVNAPHVAEIVCRLDGLPLAIELAAARVSVLPVHEIATRLDGSLRLLTGGARDADRRHESIRATLDWSYALLAESERTLLARLAVFRGGFSLAAAEAMGAGIGDGPEGIFDLLSRLVEHSLVVAALTADGEARILLHEVIRQYALESLIAMGGEVEARDRHLAFYLMLAEASVAPLHDARKPEWLDRLERDFGNLRGAGEWARRAPGHAEAGLRLVAALASYWDNRGGHVEAYRWCTEALSVADEAAAQGADISTLARAGALSSASQQAFWKGDAEAARPLSEESLALYRTLGEGARLDQAGALHSLAFIREYTDDPASARPLYLEALELLRELGDPWGLALVHSGLARNLAPSSDREGARELFEASRRNALLTGDPGLLAYVLWQWARADATWGAPAESARLYGQALQRYAETRNGGSIGTVFQDLADLLVGSGDALPPGLLSLALRLRHATVLYGAAEQPLRRAGLDLQDEEKLRSERLQATARAGLGADAYAAAYAEGQAMTLEAAVAYAETVVQAITTGAAAKGGAAPPPTSRQATRERFGGLTAREREVAELVAQGRSNREIAAALVLSERTVDTHVTHILNRLGYNSRSQIAAWAVRVGLHS